MQKFFLFIMFLVTSLGWSGCKIQPTISSSSDHEREHTNTKSHNERVLDSTFIDRLREVIVRNDTVFVHDSIYISKWSDRLVTDSIHDTLYINNTDTIIQPVEIENPIAPFVRNSCIALWSIIGVAFLALVCWLLYGFATGKITWLKIVGKLFGL